MQPLRDAHSSLVIPDGAYPRRSARDALAIILAGCEKMGSAFWAWSSEEWMGVFKQDQTTFRREYPGWIDPAVRAYAVAIAYLLGCFEGFWPLGGFQRAALAGRIFGKERVGEAVEQITAVLRGWGYTSSDKFEVVVCEALLANRSPRLADLTAPVLEELRSDSSNLRYRRSTLYGVHRALHALGYVGPPPRAHGVPQSTVEGVPPAWEAWVQRWHETSPLTPHVRANHRTILYKAGRWLTSEHPKIEEPQQWTRELCAQWVAAVTRLHAGDYAQRREALKDKEGKPLAARTKASYIAVVRRFFRDIQEWEWIPRRFNPERALTTPKSLLTIIGPDPRTISDEVWAKLLWAGLNLEAEDLPVYAGGQHYPLVLGRALAVVWLFAGLRSDEIVRLRVGCARFQQRDVAVPGRPGEVLQADAVCLLDVPPNKTGSAFTKPVDPIVGRAIAAWQEARPEQPPMTDRRTGEREQFLFCYRAKRVAKEYINNGIIPTLCRKAGVPLEDVRGRITSHRARSTIASQLYNAKEPMDIFALKDWLGHSSLETTQHYARISPTKLAKAYTDAGYFERNVRAVEVLVDREAVKSGAAAEGEPWQHYDLGHGYCTYTFFEQCPHRMACARCDFYMPKGSSKAQVLEAKDNLQRMMANIPLTEEEQAAVEDGTASLERLLERLADVPTPAGPTPRQLSGEELPVIPLKKKPKSEGGRA